MLPCGRQEEDLPLVHVGVFIEKATPFLEDFLERLTLMTYPTARIRLFIHNNVGGGWGGVGGVGGGVCC